MIRIANYCMLLCLLMPLTGICFAQESTPDGISKVVAETQKRMAKIIGATAGRIEGYGSGIIVSAEGHIVTSQGVYLDGPQVSVLLPDGSEHIATILRRDRVLQLALLKIERPTPDFFDLGSGAIGQKGDWVLAVSNAFKVADMDEPLSVTLGNISLFSSIDARMNERDVAYRGEMILIDAITSNPGAAGGAVVSLDGKLVGVVGKIINSSETNTRLNYAVPIKLVADFVAGKTVDDNTTVATVSNAKRADLGIKLFTLGGRKNPAYVDHVVADGPAAKAGLLADDMIVSISGEKIGNIKDFENAIEKLIPGQEILIIVKRGTALLRIPLVPGEKE